jgi:hypothetical protein
MKFRGITGMGILAAVLLLLTGCMTPSRAFDRMEQAVGTPPSISVSASGTVESQPDAASLRISISEIRESTREAQDAVNGKISQVIEAAASLGIAEDAVKTSSLSVGPEYQWNEGERKLLGQRVRQSLTIDIDEIHSASLLLDELGMVDGIEVSSLNIYLKDTEAAYEQARELAFTKAQQKAEQFARLGGVVLGKPLSISENSSEQIVRTAEPKLMMSESAAYTPTQLPSGGYSVTVSVHIQFAIE